MGKVDKNVLSFDIEYWNSTSYLREDDRPLGAAGKRTKTGLCKILDILRKKNIKATFFVLGDVAADDPEVVRMIDSEGHEVSTHGCAHKIISEFAPEAFEKDLRLSIEILEGITGKKVRGYRAPGYSVTKDTVWALDIVKKCGLKYDSSVYPVSLRLFTRGGISGYPRKPFFVRTGLAEFPLPVMDLFGVKIPVATAAYFRIFPYAVNTGAIRAMNRKGIPAVVNLHDWEFDPEHPAMRLPAVARFKHYHNLYKTEERLDRLTDEFDFVGCGDALEVFFR
jgi:peptidoglycan-N-acetylglucosamine deacetylase